jgi:hypothetical protein
MDASGWAIDRKYLQPRPMEETWSDLVFPIEFPALRDFRIWKDAIPQIPALGGRLHLGRYIQQGHKIWEWRYDLKKSKLYHCKGKLVDIYKPSQFEGTCTRANQYSWIRHDQAGGSQGRPCTVGEAGLGIYKIIFYTDMPPQITRSETFMDVIREWGCPWMCEDM